MDQNPYESPQHVNDAIGYQKKGVSKIQQRAAAVVALFMLWFFAAVFAAYLEPGLPGAITLSGVVLPGALLIWLVYRRKTGRVW